MSTVHFRESWGADGSICGRLGINSEAVLAPELVTCGWCLGQMRAVERAKRSYADAR